MSSTGIHRRCFNLLQFKHNSSIQRDEAYSVPSVFSLMAQLSGYLSVAIFIAKQTFLQALWHPRNEKEA